MLKSLKIGTGDTGKAMSLTSFIEKRRNKKQMKNTTNTAANAAYTVESTLGSIDAIAGAAQ